MRRTKNVETSSTREKIAVVGAGAWGTTLAWMLARRGFSVSLWVRRAQLAEQIAGTRRNPYRPEIHLPPQVHVTADIACAVSGAWLVILAVPSHGLRQVVQNALEHWPRGAIALSAAKGLERPSGLTMSQVIAETLGDRTGAIAALSGPNLSEEIVRGSPSAAVVASQDDGAARACQETLSSDIYRVYTNTDIIGVELCGALKNVIAVAAGISDGLGYGENTKAALITRGLVEMSTVVAARGGDPRTCWGLAGVGDLVATCHSPLSRNYSVGYMIGRGETVSSAASKIRGVAEGLFTSSAIIGWAQGKLDLPIAQAVHDVVNLGLDPADVAQRLMARPRRAEL
ncbi:MAG: NAD(P)-dependent glycerol-3-phosphate dehydrogenase [Armatimonadetes bacterium]|nr:NAD(P)-dependent glycerol-3-phosphate dehydrogenase [Armatimonadota bacterium]